MSSDEPIFFMLGVGLIVAAILLFLQRIIRLAGTKTARGTIVRSEIHIAHSGAKVWHPVIEFVTESAGRAEFRSTVGAESDKWKPGDVVAIRYDPAKPSKAVIDQRFNLFMVPMALGLLGLILTAIALIIDFKYSG